MGVMNVKRGTQTFSKAEQTSSLKGDQNETGGAEEFKKAFGGQDMGQVLNKVADPNWVDPTKKMRGVGNAELGKDAFMKMMLAQMKNQDPTNPTPSHEMAAQLAQFSSLEQLSNINTSIEGLKQATAPQGNYQALAFIGKKVSGDGSVVTRVKGDTKHDFSFELMGDAAKAKITVKDGAGNLVRTLDMNNLKKGQNHIEWNGIQEDGTPARVGDYHFAIEATSSTGGKVYAKTAFEGRITGMNFGAEGPILMVGKKQIRMSEVKKIEEAPLEEAPGAVNPVSLKGGDGSMPPQMAAALAKAGGGVRGAGAGSGGAGASLVGAAGPGAGASAAGSSAGAAGATGATGAAGPASGAVDLRKANAEAEIPPAEDIDASKIGNIADVPMAQGMLNKLTKELK